MKTLKKTLAFIGLGTMLYIPSAFCTTSTDIEPLRPDNWYAYWAPQLPSASSSDSWKNPNGIETHKLDVIRWYIRINPKVQTVSPGNPLNPENVKRVERLMPEQNFNSMYPNATLMTVNSHRIIPGKIYNYTNLLKAIAAMPAYCSDYGTTGQDEKFPATITAQMRDPDDLCKRMLAMTLAHASQEVSDGIAGDIQSKIKNTFAQVEENDGDMGALLDASGPFSLTGEYKDMVKNNKYYGRGIKQVSYPSQYANASLLLYGDLRLVEHPQLMAEGFLPFLSSIQYALTPKDSRQSIVEEMDGSFGLRAKGTTVEDYDRDFSTTISLVNGGPECMGKNLVATKNRIDTYAYFAKDGHLFNKGFDPLQYNHKALSGCEGINHDNPEYFNLSRRYYKMDDTGNINNWGPYSIFGGKQARDIFFPGAFINQ